MKTAFIVAPIKKIRSCPNLIMMSSGNLSPTRIKKEAIIGSAMALTSYMFIHHGQHHTVSFEEMESIIALEAVDITSNLKLNKKSFLNRTLKQRKIKGFLYLIIFPWVVRMVLYISLQIIL